MAHFIGCFGNGYEVDEETSKMYDKLIALQSKRDTTQDRLDTMMDADTDPDDIEAFDRKLSGLEVKVKLLTEEHTVLEAEFKAHLQKKYPEAYKGLYTKIYKI
jgi:hypothetical protein